MPSLSVINSQSERSKINFWTTIVLFGLSFVVFCAISYCFIEYKILEKSPGNVGGLGMIVLMFLLDGLVLLITPIFFFACILLVDIKSARRADLSSFEKIQKYHNKTLTMSMSGLFIAFVLIMTIFNGELASLVTPISPELMLPFVLFVIIWSIIYLTRALRVGSSPTTTP